MTDGTGRENISRAFVLRNHIILGRLPHPKYGVNPLLTTEPRRYPPDLDYSARHPNLSHEPSEQMEEGSSDSETIELFRNAVDTAHQSLQQSFAGSERVVEAVNPKLTVDLSHQNIEKIPEAVVDILKPGVQM